MADQLHERPRPDDPPHPEPAGTPATATASRPTGEAGVGGAADTAGAAGPAGAADTAGEVAASGDEAAEIAEMAAEFARVVGDRRACLTVTGPADVLPSRFRLTAAATVAVAAATHGAAALWAARSGQECPPISVDTRHAAASFRGERLLRIGGQPAPSLWDSLTGHYRAGDGRWVHLHCNLPHHRAGILDVLGLELLGAHADQGAVARAVARHRAAELEAELQSMGMCAAMARTADEWSAHPAGRAVAALPLIEIDRIGDDGEPRGAAATPARGTRLPAHGLATHALPSPARPAAGLRVLDLTRMLGGPVCGRTLAAFGADVLRVGAAHLPDARTAVIDTGFGKRSTFLNLRIAADARRLRELVAGADVVVQAYRPRALDRLGFGPDALASIRPGVVCASISAYGRLGPWSGLRGFDSLVQTASGLALAEAAPDGPPTPLPAQLLDHATGQLTAFGVLAALAQREVSGGSWHVRLSLAQTARWLAALGTRDTRSLAEQTDAQTAVFRRSMRSEFGELSYIAPAGSVDGATHGYDRPPASLGAHQPAWAPIR
jgi:crotonobetainyl-CoA:carnitine CoA-transferase CaiB-like acyl-CoA transferase